MPWRHSRFRWYWPYATLIAVYLVLASVQIHKNPLTMDEVDYYQCMANTAELGLPLYYAREAQIQPDLVTSLGTRVLGGRNFGFYRYRPESGVTKESFFALTDGNSRYTWCMWHPPLYVYLGSLVFRCFDLNVQNSFLLRYVNLVFSIGTIAGMARLSSWLYPQRRKRACAVALLLYATCDLAVRGTILVDYNASLAPCVATWFVLCLLDSVDRGHVTGGVILMTMLALGTSLGYAVSLLLASAAYLLLRALISGWLDKPWPAIAGILIGAGAFLLTFWAMCRIAGLPFEQPFLHSFARIGVGLTGSGVIGRATMALRYSIWYAQQIGPATCITFAVLAVGLVAVKSSVRRAARVALPLFIFTGIMTQASLGAEAYGFPKYVLFVLPWLCVYLGGEGIGLLSGARLQRLLGLCGLAMVLATQVLGSYVVVTEPGYTLYNRGQMGVVEAGNTLSALTRDNEVLLCSKDVGFYAERKFVEWYGPFLSDAGLLGEVVESERIRYAARSSPVSQDVQTLLESRFTPYAVVGGYEVLGPPVVSGD